MTPVEVLDRAIGRGLVSSHGNKVPGSIINRMSKEEREVLKNLRAQDIQVRVDFMFGGADGNVSNRGRSRRWSRM